MKVVVVTWDWKDSGVGLLHAVARLQADHPDDTWVIHLPRTDGDYGAAVIATERLSREQASRALDDADYAVQPDEYEEDYEPLFAPEVFVDWSDEWDSRLRNYPIPSALFRALADAQSEMALGSRSAEGEVVDYRLPE